MKILGILTVFAALLYTPTLATDCIAHNICECLYDDGSGYNLKPVVDGDNPLEAQSPDGNKFFYHPCGDIKTVPVLPDNVTNNCGEGYTLCMLDLKDNKTVVLGKQSDMEFKMNGDEMEIIFLKNVAQNIKHSILLECTPQSKSSILFAPSVTTPDQVHLSLYSKFACLNQVEIKHHGFFYNLFIILLTLLFVYLFIGMLVNYFFIGARGYELLPNYDFWCKVWKSLKLGFIYVKNGCRVIPADDTYDAI